MAMKKLLIPAVTSAAVLLAAPAHADTQRFLDYMQNHGYTNAKNYLSQGQQECEAPQSDTSESWSIDQLEHCLNIAESQLIATAAHQ